MIQLRTFQDVIEILDSPAGKGNIAYHLMGTLKSSGYIFVPTTREENLRTGITLAELKDKEIWMPTMISNSTLSSMIDTPSLLVSNGGAYPLEPRTGGLMAHQTDVLGKVIWVIDAH